MAPSSPRAASAPIRLAGSTRGFLIGPAARSTYACPGSTSPAGTGRRPVGTGRRPVEAGTVRARGTSAGNGERCTGDRRGDTYRSSHLAPWSRGQIGSRRLLAFDRWRRRRETGGWKFGHHDAV